jgi:hypothetical protein
MTDINIIFSRRLLAAAHADVKRHFPEIKLRDAWVYHFGRDHWEFHGPSGFYWDGRADNAYDARYHGWLAWLKSKGIEEAA